MKTKKLIVIAAISCVLFGLYGGATMTAEAHRRGGGRDTILEYLMQTDGAQALVAVVEFFDDSNGSSACRRIVNKLDNKRAKVVLFAPDNDAFEQFLRLKPGELDGLDIEQIKSMLPDILDRVELTEEALCDLLLNHVAIRWRGPKVLSKDDLLARGEITVANDSVFPISVGNGDVAINYESEIGKGDVIANNGVIHFVKSVIRNEPPPSGDVVTVFVTQTAYQGDLGGLDGADAICQQRAEAAGLTGTNWKAWLSDNDAPATDRIPDGQYRLVDGTLVADNKTDLTDGLLKAPINLNEYDQAQSGLVWTATNSDGTGTGNTCNNWTDASSQQGGCPDPEDPNCGSVGSTSATNDEWTKLNAAPFQCSAQYNLYCFGVSE